MTTRATTSPTVVRTERGLTIAGTRLTLYSIMDYVKAGHSPEYIRDSFRLRDEQIASVMQYIDEHREQVEAEYQQVLQQAEENRRYWEEQNRERFAEIAALPPKPEHAAILAKIAAHKARLNDT
jgi:uncharacterized protein (DUF433 family)